MNTLSRLCGILAFSLTSAAVAAPRLLPLDAAPAGIEPVPVSVGGRVVDSGAGRDKVFRYQWPGVYFEAAFSGAAAWFRLGPGKVILQVSVDGQPLPDLVKPAPGYYAVEGLDAGRHLLRIDVASESQAGPNEFGGVFAGRDGAAPALPKRGRALEFIGDSHTVGYGNVAAGRECSADQVWAATDNTQAFGPAVARHYDADYRIHAISGRGVVRNYDGFAGDLLPQAYPHALFDKSAPALDGAWQPDAVVIALGTNDFSTPLKATEPWKTRDELHADYERTYAGFVRSLRQRYPHAWFILWATDLSNGEIQSEVRKVAAVLRASGENRVVFLPIGGLSMAGCHYHPSASDDMTIAQRLIGAIDAIDGTAGVWPAK